MFNDVEGQPGIITAGTSSGITDGGAALIAGVGGHGARPRAEAAREDSRLGERRRRSADHGHRPVPAMQKLRERTGLTLDDFDLVELNEAFAAQVLAVLDEVPIAADRLNVNGGAIALGHPIGCTGARIVVTLLHELERRGAQRGLATLCVSGGMGMALAIERSGGIASDNATCAMRYPGTGSGRRHRGGRQGPPRASATCSGGRSISRCCRGAPTTSSRPASPFPPNGYAMLRDDFDAIFIGALGDPRVPDNRHARDILLGTRFELDLYVNYRPVKLLDARLCPLEESRRRRT